MRKTEQHNRKNNCSKCQSSLKPVCIETIWLWVWGFCPLFVPLQSSNTVSLMLVTSWLMTLQHRLWHLCMLSQRVSLLHWWWPKNASLPKPYIHESMNDNPISDYIKFSVWHFIVLTYNNTSSFFFFLPFNLF